MSEEEEKEFNEAEECHICDKKYKEGEKGVRDHCHITGKYRGSAHNECNLKFKVSADDLKIQVVFHNLRGYDGHLIVKEIGGILKEENKKIDLENIEIVRENEELYKNSTKDEYEQNKKKKKRKLNIGIIPKNIEQYLTFSIGNVSFIDSAQFLLGSLEKLAENNKDNLKYVREYFKDDEEFELAKKKGVYPYSYIDSFEKFNETNLPDKKYFYNDLVEREIEDKDYEHAKKVWQKFKIKKYG